MDHYNWMLYADALLKTVAVRNFVYVQILSSIACIYRCACTSETPLTASATDTITKQIFKDDLSYVTAMQIGSSNGAASPYTWSGYDASLGPIVCCDEV